MEATVRYIATDISVVDGRTYAVGNKPALCFRGETYALGIVNEPDMVCTIQLDLRDHDKSPLVRYGAEAEYPVGRYITHLERLIESKPISPDALQLLKQWPNCPADFGDPIFSDEELDPPTPRQPPKPRKANCIPALASEHKTTPQKIRKFLRSQGLRAPYDNEKEIRAIMENYKE